MWCIVIISFVIVALRKPKFHELDRIEHQGKVVQVIHSVAHKWEQFAMRLHFEFCDIKRIEKRCHLEPVEACQHIAWEWLQGKGREPKTWMTVVEALNEIDLSELAKDLTAVLEAGGR